MSPNSSCPERRLALAAVAVLVLLAPLEPAMSAPPSAGNLSMLRGAAYRAADQRLVVSICFEPGACRLYGGRADGPALDPLPLDPDHLYAWPNFDPDTGALLAVRWRRDMDTRKTGEIRHDVVSIDARGREAVLAGVEGFLTSPAGVGGGQVVAFRSERLGVDPGCLVDCHHHAETWRLVRIAGGKASPAGPEVDFAGGVFPWGGGRFLAAAARRDGPTSVFAPTFLIGDREGPVEVAASPAALKTQAAKTKAAPAYPGSQYLAVLEQKPQASVFSAVEARGVRSVRANTAITPSGAAVVVDASPLLQTGRLSLRKFQWSDRASSAWSPAGAAASLKVENTPR